MSPDSGGDGQGHPPLRGVLLSPCPFFEGSKNVTGENRDPALQDASLGGTSSGGTYRRFDPPTPPSLMYTRGGCDMSRGRIRPLDLHRATESQSRSCSRPLDIFSQRRGERPR